MCGPLTLNAVVFSMLLDVSSKKSTWCRLIKLHCTFCVDTMWTANLTFRLPCGCCLQSPKEGEDAAAAAAEAEQNGDAEASAEFAAAAEGAAAAAAAAEQD